eukprot:COSAG02_NODE_66694_length_254_cov_2.206452_1_plen_30_part_01
MVAGRQVDELVWPVCSKQCGQTTERGWHDS